MPKAQTRKVKGEKQDVSSRIKQAAKAAASRPLRPAQGQWTITANTGRFTIVPPSYEFNRAGHRELVSGIVLDFHDGRYFTSDKDVVDAVKGVLAGEYGHDLQQLALRDQLTVVEAARPLPPIPAWDTRTDCVDVAAAAGLLDTPEKIESALLYEQTKMPAFQRRSDVIEQLEAMAGGADAPAAGSDESPTFAL